MILPELQTILGRAAANRARLNELLGVLDGEHWLRRHPDDVWSVRDHLQHLASIEPLITRTLQEAAKSGSAWLCGSQTAGELRDAREVARMGVSDLGAEELLAKLDDARAETVSALAVLQAADLDSVIRFPPASEWASPVAMPLRGYLQHWAAHDLDHEHSIREAITVPPGPADLASSLRMRTSRHRA